MKLKTLARAMHRCNEVNYLLCNVGLRVAVKKNFDVVAWVVNVYDSDGVWMGHYRVYKHERSMLRAAWRIYRQRVGE